MRTNTQIEQTDETECMENQIWQNQCTTEAVSAV